MTASTSAQLIVDAPAFVPFRSDDVKSAEGKNFSLLRARHLLVQLLHLVEHLTQSQNAGVVAGSLFRCQRKAIFRNVHRKHATLLGVAPRGHRLHARLVHSLQKLVGDFTRKHRRVRRHEGPVTVAQSVDNIGICRLRLTCLLALLFERQVAA